MDIPTQTYPLAWPDGWERTRAPRVAPYKLTMEAAAQQLARELRLMGARQVVITSNVMSRRDGLPRSGMPEPRDPGVAVYWQLDTRPMVMACDAWRHARSNVRAVGLAVESLRQLQRCGASQLLERAYAGFRALPSEAGPGSADDDWRTVLGASAEVVTRAQIDRLYRAEAAKAHPDKAGGDASRFHRVTRAYRIALAELA